MKKITTKNKVLSILLVLIMVAMAMTGCGSSSDDEKGSISIYIGNTIFDGSLDPVKGAMYYGFPFTNNSLTKVTPESEYIGDLAEKWNVSEDALTYTFELKEGIKFHDGSDFTAEDVVFTYETVKKNQGNNTNVDLSRMNSVKAVDEQTVVFELSEPYSSFLDQTAALGIVPSDGYDSGAFDTKPIGTGPWKVAQYDTEQKIIVEANDDYFDGAPAIKQVSIMNMESDTAIANAKSGELDVIMVDPNYTEEVIDGMHVENLETMDVRNASLPVTPETKYTTEDGRTITVGNDITADKAVREALTIGIDRQKIIDNALNGIGKKAEGFTDNLEWSNAASFEDNRKNEAEGLLEDAGWTKNNDGIYQKDGRKCEFTILVSSGDTERFQLSSALAEEAKLFGVKIDVEQVPWDELTERSGSCSVMWGWGQFDPVVLKNLFYSESFTGDGTANTVRYDNPEVDALIDKALAANNREDALAAWKEVQTKTQEDYAYLYIVNIEHSYFVSDRLDIMTETQVPHPHGHGTPIINNMAQWTFTEDVE